MNGIINKFLLAGDKFMPEMLLRQLVFTYTSCGPFAKNKERIETFRETGDSRYICPNEADNFAFYGYFKDLPGRAATDKI